MPNPHTPPPVAPPVLVARFPVRRYWETPTKNFQCCDIIYAGASDTTRTVFVASVVRTRKTKRSEWTIEVWPMRLVSWVPPAELRAHFDAIATAAETIEWPAEEVAP